VGEAFGELSVVRGELTHELGYEKHDVAGHRSGNSRNGTSPKTMKGELGNLVLEVPRDRNGEFEPQLIAKHQTRLLGFDEKMISMYARGMSTRDIQAHLQEMYGVEISPGLISEVTNEVMEEVKTWQIRPLEPRAKPWRRIRSPFYRAATEPQARLNSRPSR